MAVSQSSTLSMSHSRGSESWQTPWGINDGTCDDRYWYSGLMISGNSVARRFSVHMIWNIPSPTETGSRLRNVSFMLPFEPIMVAMALLWQYPSAWRKWNIMCWCWSTKSARRGSLTSPSGFMLSQKCEQDLRWSGTIFGGLGAGAACSVFCSSVSAPFSSSESGKLGVEVIIAPFSRPPRPASEWFILLRSVIGLLVAPPGTSRSNTSLMLPTLAMVVRRRGARFGTGASTNRFTRLSRFDMRRSRLASPVIDREFPARSTLANNPPKHERAPTPLSVELRHPTRSWEMMCWWTRRLTDSITLIALLMSTCFS